MDSDMDLLSESSEGIMETILRKLPIREAVKTSILSSCWRYRWKYMTDLLFDNRSLSTPANQPLDQDSIENFITRCLSLHEGPILALSLCEFNLEESQKIQQWLQYISPLEIKELTICLNVRQLYRVPHIVFAYSRLTSLELSECEIALPPNWNGFPNMKCMELDDVSISSEDIKSLISSCPQLESLSLSLFRGLKLTVEAANLKQLVLQGVFTDVRLANLPLLTEISFSFFMTEEVKMYLTDSSSCSLRRLLNGVPKLEKLIGGLRFTEYLSVGKYQRRSPITFQSLKSVELNDVAFEDMNEVTAMLQILLNSPALEILQISNTHNRDVVSTKQTELDAWGEKLTFPRLRSIKIQDYDGTQNEIKLLEFLLRRTPNLEVLSIVPYTILEFEEVFDVIRLATPNAAIIYDGLQIENVLGTR